MLRNEFSLEGRVLLAEWIHLKSQKLVFDDSKDIRVFGLSFLQLDEVFGKKMGFEVKRSVAGFMPACFSNIFKIISE